MCGIVGVLGGESSHRDALTALANSMAEPLRHRGPDDRGAWGTSRVGLAQRRLAILDLTPAGHQPMPSRSGRWVVVFNGEIYNHRQLRDDLADAGRHFDGTGDTETLVEAIDTWGVETTLNRANGMFAIAAFDTQTEELFLARDRLGEKPMYWHADDHRLLFASELRGLRVVPGFLPTIDERSVASLLRWSFVPHPHTIYRDVHQLAPGQLIRARLQSDRVDITVRTWWDLNGVIDAAAAAPPLTEAAGLEAINEIIQDSVRLRLLSDVPIGAFLSGGIDSGLVAAYAQRAMGAIPLRTFTVSMPELSHDEVDRASRIAAALGTDHMTIQLSRSDALGLVTSMAGIWDEPFADPSMLPTALMCRAVGREVRVCLSGDGGDELFAGYNRHVFGERLARRAGRLPVPLRHGLGRALESVPPHFFDRIARGASPLLPTRLRLPLAGDKAHKAAALLRGAGADVWADLAGLWPVEQLGAEPYGPRPIGRSDPTEAMLATDLGMVLPDQMLVKADRASMASSLEVRVPLIDYRLVDIAWRLPVHAKTAGGVGKLPLRQLAAKRLPADVVAFPKQGFDPPLAAWLRGSLKPWGADLIDGSRSAEAGWVDRTVLRRLWGEQQAGGRNHAERLWAVLMLESWLARYHG